jgi:hypothetical protein
MASRWGSIRSWCIEDCIFEVDMDVLVMILPWPSFTTDGDVWQNRLRGWSASAEFNYHLRHRLR